MNYQHLSKFLLLLFFSLSLLSQVHADCTATPIHIQVCDNGGGWNFVDLTSLESQINGTPGASVTWWGNAAGTWLLSDGEDITNYPIWGANLWVTVFDGFCTSPVTLITSEVIISLDLNDFTIIECLESQSEVSIDLTAYNTIVPGLPNLDVEWYLDQNLSNQIADVTNYTITGNETIYAVVPDTCLIDTATITIIAEPSIASEDIIFDISNLAGCALPEVTMSITLPGDGNGSVELDLLNTDGAVINTFTSVFTSGVPFTIEIFDTTIIEVISLSPDLTCPIYFTPSILDTLYVSERPIGVPTQIEACANIFGEGTFDVSASSVIINDGSGLPVTFYTDIDLFNVISNPSNFISTSTTVFAQIEGANGCNSLPIPIDLDVIQGAIATNAELHGCDDGSGQAIFDLTIIEPTILAGNTGTVTWFIDPGLNNQISDPTSFNSATADIYAVVDNGVCLSQEATINLIVDPIPTLDNSFITVTPENTCGSAMISIQFFFPGDGEYHVQVLYGNQTSGYNTFEANISNFGIAQLGILETTEFILSNVSGETYCTVTFPVPDTVIASIVSQPDLVMQAPIPEFCIGEEIDLSTLPIVDLNNSGLPIQFYSALPPVPINLIDPPLIIASLTDPVYAAASGGPGCEDVLDIPLLLNPPPIAVPIPIFGCDQGDGTALFDLTQNENLIGFATGYPVSWFVDQSLTQQIDNPENFVSSTGSVFAIVSGPGCDSDPVEVPLTVETAPTIDNAYIEVSEGADCGDGIYFVTFYVPGIDFYTVTMDYGNAIDGFQEYVGVNVSNEATVAFTVAGDAQFILTSVTVQTNQICTVIFDEPVTIDAGGLSGPDLQLIQTPEVCLGETIDLSNFVVDQNFPAFPISFHSGFPTTPANEIDPIISPVNSTTYYAYAAAPNGCDTELSVQVIVNQPGTPSINPVAICAGSGIFNLLDIEDPGFPNGLWSGPGVDGLTFDPGGQSGIIDILYTPAEPCTNPVTVQISIEELSTPLLSDTAVCTLSSPFELANLSDPNFPEGIWSGPGVNGSIFDPAGLSGNNQLTFQSDALCVNQAQANIIVEPEIAYEIMQLNICINDNPYPLDQLLSNEGLTGTWSGEGVSNNLFDPASMVGNVNLTYTPDFCATPANTTVSIIADTEIENFNIQCDPSNSSYNVSFTLSGSNLSEYLVNGEIIDGNNYQSEQFNTGDPYSIEIIDITGCWSDLLEGAYDCACITDAGSMIVDEGLLEVCLGDTFAVTSDGNTTLESDDVVVYILHDQPGNAVGNIFSTSVDGTFSDLVGVDPGTIYYASLIAGNEDGSGGIDFDDPCISVAEGVPVIFYQPTVTFDGPTVICNNTCGTYNFEFEGQPPFTFTIRFDLPGGNLGIYDTIDVNTWSFTFCPSDWSIENDSFIVEVFKFEDALCLVPEEVLPGQTVYVGGRLEKTIQAFICPGDSVFMNGIWYDSPGTKIDTIFDPGGCDTLLIIDIESLDQSETFIEETICQGDTIYVNGTPYSSSLPVGVEVIADGSATGCDSVIFVNLETTGLIQDTLIFQACAGDSLRVFDIELNALSPTADVIIQDTSGNGCDTNRHLILTFQQPQTSELTTTLCAGDTLTLGNAIFHAAQTSGVVVLENAASNGCDSVVLVDIIIDTLKFGLYSQTLCAGDSIELDGQIFSAQNPVGEIVLENGASNGCDSVILVDITIDTFIYGFFREVLCAGDSIQIGNQLFSIQNSEGEVIIENGASNGCDSVVIVDITFNSIRIGQFNDTRCLGDSITIGDQVFFAENPSGEVVIENNAPGACDSLILVDILFEAGGFSVYADTICIGDTLLYNGQVYTSSVVDSIIFFPNGGNGGCDSSVQFSLFFLPVSETFILDTLPLDSNIIINGNLYNADQSFGVEIFQAANGCDSLVIIDLTFINEHELQSANLVVESPNCPGEEGSLIIQDLNGIYDANTLRVEIEGFDTLMVNTLPFLLGGLTPGRYQLKIVDESTFSIDTNIQVEIPDLFTIAIENDPNEFTGTPIQLSLTTVGNLSSIEWAPAGVLSCTNCFDPVISQLTNDIWINASGVSPEGCIASDSILIRVKPNPASFFYIPNVFTPNDDGQNDLFGVQFIESANVQVRLLEVYDRWGQFIYSSGADGNRGWDGQFKGDPCPSGVYIYRYQIALPDGRLQEGSGDITLLR